MKTVIILFLSVLISACLAPKTQQIKTSSQQIEDEKQKQQELALIALQHQNFRLVDTAYPLLVAANTFCKEEQKPATGLIISNQFNYSESFRETAKKLFHLDEKLRITHIIPGSPAAFADLNIGDQLFAINGDALPTDKTALSKFEQLIEAPQKKSVLLSIIRDGRHIDIPLTTQPSCQFTVQLSQSDEVNAYADGHRVVITKGMLRFAETPQELSLVISHEIAHNVMSHIHAKTINAIGGTLLDLVIGLASGVSTQGLFGKLGAQAYSQEFESEADYVGLYIMARANMNIDNAELFWRRMAVEHPASINSNHSASHPATATRFIAIQQTIQQIKSKKSKGQDLLPNMKKEHKNTTEPVF